jgi:hypothetical protein
MATTLKLRRGTTAQHATFTGALGEVTVDTDKDVVVVHDGSTAGGFPAIRAGGALGTPSSGTVTNLTGTASININGTVGATTAAAGTFTTLTSTGNTTLGDASADTVTINGTVQPGVVVSGTSSGDALRITQLGTGNALVVEDEANPDSSPFVIDASGRVINGHTASLSVGIGGNLGTQLLGSGGASGQTMARFDDTVTGARFQFLKSRSSTTGSSTIVQDGDTLGSIAWYGDDGAADYAANGGVLAAFINANVDGTPGTNDMPGRLVFGTTADGTSTPVERMRIDSEGRSLFSYPVVSTYSGVEPYIQNNGQSQNVSSSANIIWSTTSGSEPHFFLAKMRSATAGGTTSALISGDNIGRISFAGSTGAGTTETGAFIFSETTGAWTTTVAPTRLQFATQNASGVYGSFSLEAGGLLTSQPTYDNTASGSAVVVTSAGLIRRTSSSLKYKKDVETLDYSLVSNAIESLRPVWYRTKTAAGDDKETWSHIGLIAEEVHEVEPRLVRYRTVDVTTDEFGKRVETPLEVPEPEDVDYGRLAVLLLAEVKTMKNEISELRAEITALKGA